MAERQNNTVKNELLKDIKFHSIGEVRRAMAKAVEFYNNERPHMSLKNMTPRQAASCNAKIQKNGSVTEKSTSKIWRFKKEHVPLHRKP